jgi:gliding motility-associated-like protein
VHNLRTIDLSAIDPDGDSLAYELVTPFTGPRGTPNNPDPYTPPPFNTITWLPGFSTSNSIPGTPPLTLDPITGLLSCNASQLGLYAFAYRVVEYRNGIRIGEIQRDLQLEVLTCNQEFDPVIFEPAQDEFVVSADGVLCFTVSVMDSNSADTLILSSSFSDAFSLLSAPPNSLSRTGIGSTSGTICWAPGCEGVSLSSEELTITLKATSLGCTEEVIVEKEISIRIEDIPEALTNELPNVFTPNNDDYNDLFTVAEVLGERHPCMEDVLVRVFNRWGNLVFESSASTLDWDGKYEGQDASQGVYYYTVEGRFGAVPFSFRHFLTLTR